LQQAKPRDPAMANHWFRLSMEQNWNILGKIDKPHPLFQSICNEKSIIVLLKINNIENQY